MKVYIAGAITNDPDYKIKFDCAERLLRSEGHAVVTPAKNKPPKIWQRFLRISLDAFLEMDDATIKNNLEKKRNELGLSQTEMARRLEISLNAYRKLEKGKTRILNEHVEKFAEKTGVSVAELVNGFEPISSASAGLDDVKENYSEIIRNLENGYLKEIAMLRKEIERLSEKVKDKEEIISMDRKLIRRYEDELGLKAGE